MRIPIVFSTDHNFVMPTCVTILSLLRNSKEETQFDIHIIVSQDVTDKDRTIIKAQVEKTAKDSTINFVEIGKIYDNGYETRGISTACYSRLLIPWLLPQYDKIIYSDVDIIYKGDISEVYEIDLGSNFVGGVTGEVWNKGMIKKYLTGLGLDSQRYINSGFLLINSSLQRKENLKEHYNKLVGKRYVYQDQDIINIVCNNRIELLPRNYNVKPSMAAEGMKDVKLIHYIGIKPWQYFTYCWDDWWSVCKESLVYDPRSYKKLCGEILGLKTRCSVLMKQIKENSKFRIKLFSH